MADNFKLIQARKFQLAGSISLADTSITVKLFTDPNGTDLTMTDFGAIGYGTLEPSTSKMEIISFTGVTQNGNSTATLTGVTRGLKFVEPYDQDLTLRKSHGGNAVFILTNNPQVYAQFTSKNNNETVAEEWTFSTNPVKGSATLAASNDAYITKNDLLAATLGTVITDQVVIPGTAGETITTKQIVYFKESDQRWWLADADLVGTFNQVVVAVAQNNANAGASLNVLLQGLDKTQTGMTLGSMKSSWGGHKPQHNLFLIH